MTAVLGISAFYHDSAAALVVDGRIVAAAQEERFTRRKHDEAFPSRAIDYCLAAAGIGHGDLDQVVFYEKPLLKFDRLLETYQAVAPAGFRSFLMAAPLWLRKKLHLPREIRRGLHGKYRRRVAFCGHHEAHAASAFLPSPFAEAAFLCVDGVGEWDTCTFGRGVGNRIETLGRLEFPHSLGLLYSAFTYFCGFKVNSGEYKLMGLAPYGDPVYVEPILQKLVDLREDGSFRLDMSYFNYCRGLTMTSEKFHALMGGAPRRPESPITRREMDMAASIQRVTEIILLRMAAHVHRVTGSRNLCLAGGVALNCVANGRISREGPFERIWVQPAAGDAGGALGAALFTWHQLLGNPREPAAPDAQGGSLLGPSFDDAAIRATLDARGAVHTACPDDESLCAEVAGHLARGAVVGWFQGRMEFGPRALGARSILGDPRDPRMQSVMNLKIKFRESFRPFAPVVLAERAEEFFGLRAGQESPYMLMVAPVRESLRQPGPAVPAHGLDRVKECRSVIPAVTHVDYSARVQTVDRVRNPLFHRLLSAFERATGCPVLINTSFNVRGEPLVCTPEEALNCFLMTNIDVLVLGRRVLLKERQPAVDPERARQYLSSFSLD